MFWFFWFKVHSKSLLQTEGMSLECFFQLGLSTADRAGCSDGCHLLCRHPGTSLQLWCGLLRLGQSWAAQMTPLSEPCHPRLCVEAEHGPRIKQQCDCMPLTKGNPKGWDTRGRCHCTSLPGSPQVDTAPGIGMEVSTALACQEETLSH